MFTQEQTDILSKALNIQFQFNKHVLTTIFSDNDTSYIDYDPVTTLYEFHLDYGNASFQFSMKSIEPKKIFETMKEMNQSVYCEAVKKSQIRSSIYKKLKREFSAKVQDS